MPKNNGSETTVIRDNEKMLKDSCMIRLEECKKLIQLEKTRSHTQLRIEFNDLHYSVCQKDKQKVILCNVTGHFDPGKLTVLIGPSGAGKTTLLKIVLGELLLNVKGTVTINGIERNKGTFRKQMCYVRQQFALLPYLTTRETLYIAARLKLDANQTRETIHLIVDEIAENLGLYNCLDTMAKNLSGGERKRLSIGQEIIIKPTVLLLDEPTSGLDSIASNQLINMLHTMAKANCTIICAIHQPTSQMIMQFDDILVLNQGKCVYCGPQSEILNTFNNAGFVCPQFYNIAEFVLEVITAQRNGDLDNLYKFCRDEYEKSRLNYKSENDKNLSTTSKKDWNYTSQEENSFTFTNNINDIKQGLSTWQQQQALLLRALICIKRDNIMTKLRFATHIVVGILLGLVFYDFGDNAQKVNSNIAYLFFVIMFLFFINALTTVQIFPNEAAVFIQEYSNHWYNLRSYYSVKILTDLPMQLLCSTCFFIISYYITGQPMELNRIMQAWSVCVLITIFGQTTGVFTGTIFNTEIGTFFIPALSIPLLLFSGFFVKLGETSEYLQPLGYISFFRYAFEGLIQALYINRPNLSCLEIYCYLRSPRTILSMMEMPTVSFYKILIILSSWILCLHVIVYAVLYWRACYSRK